MGSAKGVGSSNRTVFKHKVLGKVVGREVGAAGRMPGRVTRQVLIDLTAGDGRDTAESGLCSPGILAHHAAYPKGVVDTVILVERDRNSVASLRESLKARDFGRARVVVIHGDSRDSGVIERIIEEVGPTPTTAVFIYSDPNAITQHALSEQLLSEMPEMTTTMSTLGCNVGGLLRLDQQKRVPTWSAHVNTVIAQAGAGRDVIFVALQRDDSRWAYLLTTPNAWSAATIREIEKASADWPKGVGIASNRTDHKKFADLVLKAFCTADELKEMSRERDSEEEGEQQ